MGKERKPRLVTPLIFNDQPLQPDEPSYFQFDDYARTFARIIAAKHTCTPLTIGVHGEWGSGKTTLMRGIRAYLDQTTGKGRPDFLGEDEALSDKPDKGDFRPVRTVWFNAWKYSREEALFVALVEEVLREMRRDGTITRLYAALSDPKQPRVQVTEAVLSTLSQVFSLGKIDLDLTRFEAESRFKANLAFLDEFLEVFDRLVGWWLYKDDVPNRRIDDRRGVLTIFIDDLDRCLPEKTVQVLECIKLMMDRPGTVFVIGASRKVVEAAVAAHYRNFEGLRRESGLYLDKIIQVRFDLPPLREEGEQSLADFLEGLQAGGRRLAEANPSLVESLRLLTRGGEGNPRRIKTFINYAELQWALLVNSGQAGEVDQGHFHLWLVLTGAGGEPFRAWLENLPVEERPPRIREAIAFVRRGVGREGGEEEPTIDPNLGKLLGEGRLLRGVLAQLETFEIGPEELDLYIHLCAPPVEEVEEPAPARAAPSLSGLRPEAPGEFGVDRFVRVPAGPFLMGSADDDPDAYDAEKPQHEQDIPYDYLIGRYPVTNQEFRRFVEDPEGYRDDRWWTEAGWAVKEEEGWTEPRFWDDAGFNHPLQPVVRVSWYEAVAYCRWLTERLRRDVGAQRAAPLPDGWVIRLPTEAEWEKAARGEYGRRYPWGDEWDSKRCNSGEGGPGRPTEVGRYSPDGDSPYGAADMAGNVWEWCATKWVEGYEGYPEKEDNSLEGTASRVVRGGSFGYSRRYVRCASRNWLQPCQPVQDSGVSSGGGHAFPACRNCPAGEGDPRVRSCLPGRGEKNGAARSWPAGPSLGMGATGQIQKRPAPWVRPWGGAPCRGARHLTATDVRSTLLLGKPAPGLPPRQQGETQPSLRGRLRVSAGG